MNKRSTCRINKFYYIASSIIMIFIIFTDINTTKNSFNNEFRSFFLYAFGGIDINIINRKVVVRYILVTVIYIFMLFNYLDFAAYRNYLLLLRFRDRKTFLVSKIRRIFEFTNIFFGFIVTMYFISGTLFLDDNNSNMYINVIYNRQVSVDNIFVLKSIGLYYLVLLNIGMIAFLVELFTHKISLEYLAPLTLILVSIYSKNSFLKLMPISASMSIRFDYVTGGNNGIAFFSSFFSLTFSLILIFILLRYMITKIQVIS